MHILLAVKLDASSLKLVQLTPQALTDLKQELEFFNKRLAQSDENVEEKYTLMKEGIAQFIRLSLESGEAYETIHKNLSTLCIVDILIPSKLQDWCFNELDKLSKRESSIPIEATDNSVSGNTSPVSGNTSPVPELFSKDNIYHAIILCTALFLHDSQSYLSYFKKTKHSFNELSMSIKDSKSENEKIETYIIARKANTLFVAFNGEPFLSSWKKKYSTLEEGMYNVYSTFLCIQ